VINALLLSFYRALVLLSVVFLLLCVSTILWFCSLDTTALLLTLVFVGADIDTLCVVPKYVSRDDFFSDFYDTLKALPEVTEITPVPDSYVPVMKMASLFNVNFTLTLFRYSILFILIWSWHN
jgi:hypothetical protein